MHQLVIRGFSIVDARCNHEVNFDPYDGHSDIVKFRLTAKLQTANVATKIQQSSSYGIPIYYYTIIIIFESRSQLCMC